MATKLLTVHFTHLGTPITGLTPIIDIFELGTATNTHVVISGNTVEVGLGWYRYDFTTYDAKKNYVFTFDGGVTLDSCERYKIGGNESYAEEISDIVSVSQAAISALINTMLKYERNRTKIDVAAATLTIFDDDCTTPLTVFNLKDHLGMPSISEVCERAPSTCP